MTATLIVSPSTCFQLILAAWYGASSSACARAAPNSAGPNATAAPSAAPCFNTSRRPLRFVVMGCLLCIRLHDGSSAAAWRQQPGVGVYTERKLMPCVIEFRDEL